MKTRMMGWQGGVIEGGEWAGPATSILSQQLIMCSGSPPGEITPPPPPPPIPLPPPPSPPPLYTPSSDGSKYDATIFLMTQHILQLIGIVTNIEEVWKQKPRQTVVVVLWGKIAAHMASIKTV